MAQTYYKGDPKKMLARFNNPCAVCGKPIRTGDEIIYWPLTKKAGHFACYEPAWNAFQLAVQDEQMYQSQYPQER